MTVLPIILRNLNQFIVFCAKDTIRYRSRYNIFKNI